MTGGIPPQRPDQDVAPPPMVVSPGGASGIFKGRLVIVNGQTPPAGGIYLYDAGGQLVGYWVSIAGTDPLDGSSINPGFQVQTGTSAAQSTNIVPGIITLNRNSGVLVGPELVITDATLAAPFGNLTISSQSMILDGWHTINLDAGWSTVGGQPVPSCRMMPDGLNVEITGVATHAGFSANTNLASGGHAVSAAYRPLTTQVIGGQIPGDAALEMTTAGVLVAVPGTLASATACRFNGTYPVDL